MKQVRETKHGQSLSAYIVLKDGEHIATVQAAFMDSGVVYVDVWDTQTIVHQGKAGGYGYDKFTAALSGAVIDGHTLADHCGESLELPAKGYFGADDTPDGYQQANYDSKLHGYKSCYKRSGLEYLSDTGYQVLQAI